MAITYHKSTLAALQAITGTSGDRGFVTDVNGLISSYYWTGSAWSQSPIVHDKVRFTIEGGIAVKLTNKTGGATTKGYCVSAASTANSGVILTPVDAPDCIGVFYETGIAADAEAWVVVAGIADVYFWTNTVRGYFVRTGVAGDTGESAGQAIAEAVPSSPLATDKHFMEIGHCLETRTGAGLAKCVLHFN
jgi:hypothetical protein